MKRWSSELLNSFFLHVTLVLPYSKKTFGLNRALWLKAWMTKHTWLFQWIGGLQPLILLVLQANEWIVLLSNRRKEHRRPKTWAKASYNTVLVEGNIYNWFHYLSNLLFCFGCLTAEICMDKYIRKIITASGHHLKPAQGGTIRKQGI